MDCGPFEVGSLTDARHATGLAVRYPAYRLVLDWLESFVMQAHAQLWRRGPVCPFVAPALGRNLLWMGIVRTATSTTAEACAKALPLADVFTELCARWCGDAQLRRSAALLAVFPDVRPEEASEFIDRAHRRLRMGFVARGLMLGEFHPFSTVTSVHNTQLPVMRCPVPMFAVRALSVHDLLFLDSDAVTAGERRRYLEQYLRHFDAQLTPAVRARVVDRIARTDGPA